MFSLRGINLTINGKSLLSDIHLDLAPKQVTTLIGANGAGKSSIMKVMLAEHKVDTGQVLFKGKLLEQWTLKQLSFQRAYIAQAERPIFDVKVYDYLLLAREHHKESLNQACRWVEDVVDTVGVKHLLDVSVNRLSGGEFQLIEFARAWLQLDSHRGLEGTIMLLDEPTSALDIKQSQKLYRLLHLYRENGGTALIIEHDINQANQYCDQIIIVKHGKILVTGVKQQCFTDTYLNECFETVGYLQHSQQANTPTYILNQEWNQ
jgi:iron complex transport system ATP-binding protein